MKNFFYILISAIIFSSCSEYQKALKASGEGATAEKFKIGEKYYNEGEFSKANALFAQIVPEYRGKPQAQKLMFLYSNSFYEMKDYYVASYQFERFASSYPKSEKVEEASYLSAKSAYHLSPIYSKDQTETKSAIDKIQEFINLFPDSKYVEEANVLVKELEYKLEKKAFEIAKQFNHISDYPASIQSFTNFVFDFPGSKFREEASFYRLDSAYKLAINSYEFDRQKKPLKKIRLEAAKEYSDAFKVSHSTSTHIEDVEKMALEITEQLKKYSTKS